MKSNEILKGVQSDLEKFSTPQAKASFKRFFKHDIKCYGAKLKEVGQVNKKYWQEIKDWPKDRIFEVCEKLYKRGNCEDAFIANSWVHRFSKDFTKNDIFTFEKWIDNYIDDWAKCDGFCNHTMGDFIDKYPDHIKTLKKWAKSNNIWLKRASSVSLILPARRGEYLSDVFEIADILLIDENDMVQKGYGWMLKEASRKHQKEVFDYVVKNSAVMPRTALRYAIELMPQNLRKEAMKRPPSNE